MSKKTKAHTLTKKNFTAKKCPRLGDQAPSVWEALDLLFRVRYALWTHLHRQNMGSVNHWHPLLEHMVRVGGGRGEWTFTEWRKNTWRSDGKTNQWTPNKEWAGRIIQLYLQAPDHLRQESSQRTYCEKE